MHVGFFASGFFFLAQESLLCTQKSLCELDLKSGEFIFFNPFYHYLLYYLSFIILLNIDSYQGNCVAAALVSLPVSLAY
jgi:hypothetical protein